MEQVRERRDDRGGSRGRIHQRRDIQRGCSGMM